MKVVTSFSLASFPHARRLGLTEVHAFLCSSLALLLESRCWQMRWSTWVRGLAAKPDSLSSMLETHVEGESRFPQHLSSCLHVLAVVCTLSP